MTIKAGSWKLEAGSWKLEAGSWKLDKNARLSRSRQTGLLQASSFGLKAK
ncbi:hypothetical protein [Zobellella iuensis]|uniref:N-acetylmuramoyl-L-alanine amidase n=1 Tax=Zobellella iuensis TaxID=2803811 RepID=A0ABS1QVI5_9GAMM|nr:hypothetical protein [Zobellella iuensis]MBL1378771.1 hypothetical protein [Zobellella iuensis]